MEIKNITKDIGMFMDKINEHSYSIELLKEKISVELADKYKELNDVTEKNNYEESKKLDLESQISKLRIEKVGINNDISLLKNTADDIIIDESKRDELKTKLSNIESEILIATDRLELLKIDNMQQSIINEGLIDDDKKAQLEISRLNSIKADGVMQINKINDSIKFSEDRYNMLLKNIDVKQLNLNKMISSEHELRKQINILNDNIDSNNNEISNHEGIVNALNDSIKKAREEIKESNEIKDDISRIIENERKKNRNDENKVLAIKKEVLELIMVYRNNGDKKKMAELARMVENV